MGDAPLGTPSTACPRCSAKAGGRARYCGTCGAHLEIATGPDPLAGTILADRYRLVSLIGSSPLGTVYQAEHISMGKGVAVKVIQAESAADRGLLERLLDEFRRVSNLSSVHTAGSLDFGRLDDVAYTATEWVRGNDLGRMMRQAGPTLPARAFRMVAQVCESLSEAHEAGIVHGRLKPENVMVTRTHEGRDFVKVLDFGYCRLAEVRDEASLIAARRLSGTPHCMSPEQVREGPLDGRSDVYSVGALLYWLLVGAHVFTARTPVGVLKKHLDEQPVRPSAVRPGVGLEGAVDAVVMAALAKDPADRPSTAEDLRAELLRAAANF